MSNTFIKHYFIYKWVEHRRTQVYFNEEDASKYLCKTDFMRDSDSVCQDCRK